MSELPSSFSSLPDENPHKYFKNLLIDLKKEIIDSVDLISLQEKMQAIINASKTMKYFDNQQTDVYHKSNANKALTKIWTEFDRYILTIQKKPNEANPQALLDAIAIVETLIDENFIY